MRLRCAAGCRRCRIGPGDIRESASPPSCASRATEVVVVIFQNERFIGTSTLLTRTARVSEWHRKFTNTFSFADQIAKIFELRIYVLPQRSRIIARRRLGLLREAVESLFPESFEGVDLEVCRRRMVAELASGFVERLARWGSARQTDLRLTAKLLPCKNRTRIANFRNEGIGTT